jgi:hypothetical protein
MLLLWLWPLAAAVIATINDGPGYGVAAFVLVHVAVRLYCLTYSVP